MNKFIFIIGLCCCCFFTVISGGCASAPPAAEPDLMGLSGKLNPEAETAFSQAHVLWNTSQAFQTKVPETCSDPRAAIVLLDKAISIEPTFAAAYVRRGLAKSDLGEYEAAFDDATAGIRLAPTAEHYAYRGLISAKAGNYGAARKDLDYSLELNSSRHMAWTFRGAVGLMEGDGKAACSDFDKACSRGDCLRLEIFRQEGICP